jgi:hypothetical protein
MEVKGNMLRSPRIRRGMLSLNQEAQHGFIKIRFVCKPKERVQLLAPNGYNMSTIEDEQTSSRQQWKKRKRLSYQSKLECWETCEVTKGAV